MMSRDDRIDEIMARHKAGEISYAEAQEQIVLADEDADDDDTWDMMRLEHQREDQHADH